MTYSVVGVTAWCLLFLLFFKNRVVYLIALGLVAVMGGYAAVEYVPAVYLPIDVLLSVLKFFSRSRDV